MGLCWLRQGPLCSVSFLVRVGGTSLGRKRNNAQHIFISNCRKYIREFGLDITCLPNQAIEITCILCEYLDSGRYFGGWGTGAEEGLIYGCVLDSDLKI